MPKISTFRLPLFVWLAAFIVLAAGSFPAAAQQANLLQAEDAFRLSVDRGEDGAIGLHWAIADGYYLYRDHLKVRDASTGSEVTLQTYPGTVESDDPNFGSSEVYYTEAAARLDPATPARVSVTFQGCKKNSICYPPITQTVDTRSLQITTAAVGFGLTSEPAATGEPTAASSGFQLAEDTSGGGMIASLLESGGALWVVGSFLVFGLLLAFTPCVLPMYPILSATLAREGEALTARRGFVLSSAYVLAMAAAFGLLGIVAAWSGQNLQVILQSPYAVGAAAVLFIVLAASTFGLFELQLPAGWVNRIAGIQGGRRGSVIGAAAIGFTSALIVGPCVTAPLAAALLYIAQTGDAGLGAAALFALGLGQGIPLIALGTMGSRALPKAGAWMVQIKHVFGFVFIAAAIWMASRMLPPPATLALWAMLLLGAAVFVGVAEPLARNATNGARFRKTAGLALSLGAGILAIGAASGATDPLRPLAHFAGERDGSNAPPELVFGHANSVAELKQDLSAAGGRPTLVYFTADWCVTCGVIERDVLPARDAIAGLQGFQRIKVDLSTLDQDKQALMRELAVVGPPTMIFFNAQASEIPNSRLVGDVTAEPLKTSMARAVR
ncbi:protein-disulfide reductase DsbD [Mesorhizobium shangrilense]|uniref:Protein-disulfide reductase DsbD n=1 Tax=Mesorhizobium shangrilense TaxID=460060 RepID=A0ABV2DN68_9HYPH